MEASNRDAATGRVASATVDSGTTTFASSNHGVRDSLNIASNTTTFTWDSSTGLYLKCSTMRPTSTSAAPAHRPGGGERHESLSAGLTDRRHFQRGRRGVADANDQTEGTVVTRTDRPFGYATMDGMAKRSWRAPSKAERAVFDKLLTVDFGERDAVKAQLEGCQVRRWCVGHCPSIEFQVSEDHPPIAAHSPHNPVGVEGRGVNPADGIVFDVMLFHRDGRLSELEFVVYGDPMLEIPSVSTIDFTSVDRPARTQ